MQDVSLEGLRVLVLEDEVLIALDLEQACRDLGAAEVIVARTLDEAETAASAVLDVAVLDIMLAGRSTVEFAAGLSARGIPFVFATGYTDADRLMAAVEVQVNARDLLLFVKLVAHHLELPDEYHLIVPIEQCFLVWRRHSNSSRQPV